MLATSDLSVIQLLSFREIREKGKSNDTHNKESEMEVYFEYKKTLVQSEVLAPSFQNSV